MSLRFFHIVFIVASTALAILGGVWAILEQKPSPYAAVSFALGACLAAYLVWFIRRPGGLGQ